MDIYLTDEDDKKFTFPSLPEEVERTLAMGYRTYSTVTGGDYKFPSGRKDGPISWKATFYGEARSRMPFINSWQDPEECIKQLQTWMRKKKVLRILVTGTDINEDVTIEKFVPKYTGPYGDVEYSIVFQPHRDMKIYTKKEAKITSYEKKTTERNSKKKNKNENSSASSYSVKSGDTLWGLAQKYYGDGSKWTEIYKANKKSMDEAAKKHGYSNSDGGNRIFPGTSLTIPANAK